MTFFGKWKKVFSVNNDRGRNPNLGNAQIRALATDLRQGGGSPPHNVRMWGLLLVVSNNSE